jgi:hypothetical protein
MDSLASTITPLPPASVYARAALKGAHAAAVSASVCSDTLTLCSDDGTDDGEDGAPITPMRSSVSCDGDGATVFDPDSPLTSQPIADWAHDYFGLDTDDDADDDDAFCDAPSYANKPRPCAASRKSRGLFGATLAQALNLDFCCRSEGAFPSAPAPAPPAAARSSLALPSGFTNLPRVAAPGPAVSDAGMRPGHRARSLNRAAKHVRPHFALPFAHHAAAAAAWAGMRAAAQAVGRGR